MRSSHLRPAGRPARSGAPRRRRRSRARPAGQQPYDAGEPAGLPVPTVGVQVGDSAGAARHPAHRPRRRRAAGRPRPRATSTAGVPVHDTVADTGLTRGRVLAHLRRHLVAAAADRGPDGSGDRRRRRGPASRATVRPTMPARSCRGGRRGRPRRRRRPGRPAAPGCSPPPGRRGRGRALVVTSASTAGAGPPHGPSATWTSAPWHWFMNSSRSRGRPTASATRAAVRLDVGRVVTDVAAEVEPGPRRRC